MDHTIAINRTSAGETFILCRGCGWELDTWTARLADAKAVGRAHVREVELVAAESAVAR
jgi:hypothetical protein